MIDYNLLRLKHSVATEGRRLLVACLVVAVVALVVVTTSVATAPVPQSPFADEGSERVVHSSTVEQEVAVEVVNDTPAYDDGEVLRDLPLYPKRDTAPPTVTGRAEAVDATLTNLSVTVTYRAVPDDDPTATVYTDTETLASVTPSGDTGAVRATVPVSRVLDRRATLDREFGGGVTVVATVATSAEYRYRTGGGTVLEERIETSGELEDDGDRMYALPSGSEQRTHVSGGGEEVVASGLVNRTAMLAGLVAVLGAAVVAVSRHRIDGQAVERELRQEQFAEWVTEIESYTPSGSMRVVNVTSLDDLVGLAIDTRRRVLYHERVGEYIVVDGETLFKYVPESDEAGSTEMFGMDSEGMEFPLPQEVNQGGPPMAASNGDPPGESSPEVPEGASEGD